MTAIETVRSVVNTWECDENAHLNVQFYFAQFDAAGRQFVALTGLDPAHLGRRKVRHVRYHKELRAADFLVVNSAYVPDGPHSLTVAHQMFDPLTGRLMATALDGYAPDVGAIDVSALPAIAAPETVLPRSFDAPPRQGGPNTDALLAAGGAVTFRGALYPRDFGVGGNALDQTYISCLTNGAAHAWEHGGLSARWLAEEGFGRVAVEIKLSYVNRYALGDLAHMVTVFTGVSTKAFTFSHYLFESRTGKLAAIADIAGMAMDHATRRAVALPDAIREKIQAQVEAATDL